MKRIAVLVLLGIAVAACRSRPKESDAGSPPRAADDAAPKPEAATDTFIATFEPRDVVVGQGFVLRFTFGWVNAQGLSAVSIVPEGTEWTGIELKTIWHDALSRNTLRDAGATASKTLDVQLDLPGHQSTKISMAAVARSTGVYTFKFYPTSKGERLKTLEGRDVMAIATLRVRPE